jgi:hypothetical protein
MRYWWVNHKQTYKHEVRGGFLWSPKVRKDGATHHFYDNMTKVSAGDIVISYADTLVKAIGTATGVAQQSEKPDFGRAGDGWGADGWLVPVEFVEVSTPARPKDFFTELQPLLPEKYSPLDRNGGGNQSAYLSEVSAEAATLILRKLNLTLEQVSRGDDTALEEVASDKIQEAIAGRTDIGATAIQQLTQARRGQGVFKSNVRLNESGCRVTGVTDPSLLIASHIKPWKDSTDFEKLDGANGLLLAPHVDRLFDKGLISFSDNGDLLIAPQLDRSILIAWGIRDGLNVGAFTPQQGVYLAYHREFRLKRR